MLRSASPAACTGSSSRAVSGRSFWHCLSEYARRSKGHATTRPCDLPVGGLRTWLVWRKRRWYCDQQICPLGPMSAAGSLAALVRLIRPPIPRPRTGRFRPWNGLALPRRLYGSCDGTGGMECLRLPLCRRVGLDCCRLGLWRALCQCVEHYTFLDEHGLTCPEAADIRRRVLVLP
jgi:zinc-finger of transposase IS204/IS1001/IS1096/IS1165